MGKVSQQSIYVCSSCDFISVVALAPIPVCWFSCLCGFLVNVQAGERAA